MAEAAALAARRRYRRSKSEPHAIPGEDDWGDLEVDEALDAGEDSREAGRINRAATAQSRWALPWGCVCHPGDASPAIAVMLPAQVKRQQLSAGSVSCWGHETEPTQQRPHAHWVLRQAR